MDPEIDIMGQFLGPETERMFQFLGPETDIMGERYYIGPCVVIFTEWEIYANLGLGISMHPCVRMSLYHPVLMFYLSHPMLGHIYLGTVYRIPYATASLFTLICYPNY